MAARRIDLDGLSDVIGCIYDVALSDDGWDPLLERMTELFAGTATVCFVQDRRQGGLQFSRLWGPPGAALVDFESRFALVDFGIDALMALPAGSVITDESTPPDIAGSSKIGNDSDRHRIAARYIACDVFRDEDRVGILAVQGLDHRAPFGSAETVMLLSLLPHLRRAMQIGSRLGQVGAHHSTLEELIDGLLVGVVLLNNAAQVIYTNAAARRIDHLQDGLKIERGSLLAESRSDHRTLHRAIAEALETSNPVSLEGGGMITVRRPSGARPFKVLISSDPGLDSQSPFQVASALILIGDPDARLACAADLTAQLYGLTPAEARLACAAAAGESLETHAETQGTKLSTVRWTMKQVLAKTGSRRQTDLVRLLLTGPAAIVKAPSESA